MMKTINTRKVIGMGETIMDIIFRNGQPQAAVHGGSSFNSIVSVGRAGIPCVFVGDTGADVVGQKTLEFMRANHVDTTFCPMRKDVKSAVSLAYLNDSRDASYIFYKQTPQAPHQWTLPKVNADDVFLFGSYYASCQGMRPMVKDMLGHARADGAIVYYDINFRSSHSHELESLLPVIRENCRQSDIVRGSADDFQVLFGTRDASLIYGKYIRNLCPLFVCTNGAEDVTICMPDHTLHCPVPHIQDVVSTVGAGDNFNAGVACSLIWQGITKSMLPRLTQENWQTILTTACAFAGDACRSYDNYISTEFGLKASACSV
ncbi:MAG: PfkB family carbohydrate kinase [Bacteroidaceae bacterium]